MPEQGSDDEDAHIVKADYASGGLKLSAAYAKFGNGTTAQDDTKVGAIIASYDFGAINVGGGWQRETDIGGTSGNDRNKYTLGAALKVGANGTIKAQYARARDLRSTSDTGATQWALGYDHAWDSRTTLYVAYARTQNDNGAAFTSYNYGHGDEGVPGLIAGNDPQAISVGVVFKFDIGLLPR